VNRGSNLPSRVNAVFVDRDGVINRKMPEGEYVTAWSQFHLLPGAIEAVAKLNRAGLLVIVVTNQRGIALGLYRAEDVVRIHARLQQELVANGARIDGFYICPHDNGVCQCRKPQTGLFAQAIADFPGIRPESSVMVGDSFSDIEFGRNVGMKTIYIKGEAEEGSDRKLRALKAAQIADVCVASFLDAVDAVVG
jgi:D-glycero-D-manno-heptose 1,7-bisphosphate phosphatase